MTGEERIFKLEIESAKAADIAAKKALKAKMMAAREEKATAKADAAQAKADAAQDKLEKAAAKADAAQDKLERMLLRREAAEDWKSHGYEVDEAFNFIKSVKNYVNCIKQMEFTAGKLKYNEFLDRKEFDGKEYQDVDDIHIMLAIGEEIGFEPSIEKVRQAVDEVIAQNVYNPNVDYLNSLQWDGINRMDTMLIDWLGAEDTELNREMTRKWLIAGVKRVFEPGCKFDNMIVLQGPQGCGKSTLCYRLAKGFYQENINIDDQKMAVETTNRAWIACFDEMAGFGKRELADIKTFLSKQEDTVRLAFARNPKTYKRHCVFIGSTNEDLFLRDYSASLERRFWVIKTTLTHETNRTGIGFNEQIVDQIWAEAVNQYRKDPDQYLDLSVESSRELGRIQEAYKTYNNDDLIDFVKDILTREYVVDNNGEFDSEEAFLNQVRNPNVVTGKKRRLTRIPSRYVRYVCSKIHNDFRYPKVLVPACKDIIKEYKKATYHGKTDNCYCLGDNNGTGNRVVNELIDCKTDAEKVFS